MPKPIPINTWALIKESYLATKSIRRTAETVNVSKTYVEYILKKLDVPRFPRNRFGKENSSYKSIPDGPRKQVRNPELMMELYIVQRLSIPDISKKLGVSKTTVRTGLLQCGIKLRTRKEGNTGKPHYGARGSKHRDWKGGISGWRKRVRKLLNPVWVRPIMERDGFKCCWCKGTKNLVAHHHQRRFVEIVQIVRTRSPTLGDELILDAIVKEHSLNDGITLCKKCHDTFHKEHGK